MAVERMLDDTYSAQYGRRAATAAGYGGMYYVLIGTGTFPFMRDFVAIYRKHGCQMDKASF